jgi:hypothetical protein
MGLRLKTLSEKYFCPSALYKKSKNKVYKIVDNFLTVRDKKSKYKIRYFSNN